MRLERYILASVRPHTLCILAFCLRLRRRAEQRAIAQLHSRLLQCPQCARFVACLRARVLRRAAALELLSSPPRPLLHDVGYDDDSGFRFRDVRGVVTVQHPAFTATAGTILAYSPDGSVVLPVSPPSTSMVVLRPEASGAWCYCVIPPRAQRRGIHPMAQLYTTNSGKWDEEECTGTRYYVCQTTL